MQHPSEAAGHWYDRQGHPVWEVPSADGKRMVSPDLRHARKLGLLPGATSIIRCAAAPGLEIWKQQQVLMAALTLSRRHGEPDERYIARIIEDSQEQANKARDRGTAIHAAIQGHYEGEPPPEEYWLHVRAADVAVSGWMKGPWSAECSFGHIAGYGGKCDLSSNWAVVDFKTKEFGPDDELKTWNEHAMQLAAYRQGLRIPKARCAIVYVSVTHPGLARLIEIDEKDLENGWLMFRALLAFWQHKNRYDSSFTLEPVAA